MKPNVAIVIVGFRNPDDIVRCLTALAETTHADFEVAICENGGRAAFETLAAHVPATLPGGQRVRVIEAPGNLGYAGGVNLGMRHTPGAWAWWILNPDTRPDRNALAALVARLSRGDCAAVGGIVHSPDGTVQLLGGRWRSWMARPVALGVGLRLGDPIDAGAVERDQSFLSGASMLVGRRFVETAGLMREDYFLYCEEVEWCLRGMALGLRLGFAPDARVAHDQGATTGAGEAIGARPRLPVYMDERNKMLVTRDRFAARLPVAAPAALALIVLRYATRGAWRQFGHGVAGWWAGLLGRRGRPRWLAA